VGDSSAIISRLQAELDAARGGGSSSKGGWCARVACVARGGRGFGGGGGTTAPGAHTGRPTPPPPPPPPPAHTHMFTPHNHTHTQAQGQGRQQQQQQCRQCRRGTVAQVGGRALRQGADSQHIPHLGVSGVWCACVCMYVRGAGARPHSALCGRWVWRAAHAGVARRAAVGCGR
jgi:hypothetical protein